MKIALAVILIAAVAYGTKAVGWEFAVGGICGFLACYFGYGCWRNDGVERELG